MVERAILKNGRCPFCKAKLENRRENECPFCGFTMHEIFESGEAWEETPKTFVHWHCPNCGWDEGARARIVGERKRTEEINNAITNDELSSEGC